MPEEDLLSGMRVIFRSFHQPFCSYHDRFAVASLDLRKLMLITQYVLFEFASSV